MRLRLRTAAAACTVVVLVAGCDSTASTPGSTTDPSAPGPTTTPPAGDTAAGATSTQRPGPGSALTDDQVRDTVRAMDAALGAGDVEAYLEHVGPDLAEQQLTWFEAVQAVPMDVRQLRLDGVVSRNAAEGTVAHVGLRHQISGADPVPLLEQYRWVLAPDDEGTVRVVSSTGRNGDTYGHPQVWDTGEPVAVLEGHSVLLLAPESERAVGEDLLDTLDLAAERTLADLPWAGAGRELIAATLVDPDLLETVTGVPDSIVGQQLLALSPEEIGWDAPRLTGTTPPVQGRILIDIDAAVADVEEFGPAPGGHTALRYGAAMTALWGDDPDLWPQDWVLEAVPLWWSAAEDPPYLAFLLEGAAEHHAVTGAPTELPSIPLHDDPVAYGDYQGASLSLVLHLAETYGDEALIDLAGRLATLDQRYDEAEIADAYVAALGVDQDQVVSGWATWAAGLEERVELGPSTERG